MSRLSSQIGISLRSWRGRMLSPDTSAPFYPTPLCVARQMLEAAEAAPSDTVYDLGSGDGRIPILAAQEFGCRAVGIEMNKALYRRSISRISDLRLEHVVRFERANFLQADFRSATIVTLYLLSAANEQLQPRLSSHLRHGARVVSLEFPVPGWKPDEIRKVHSVNHIEYTVYVYRRSGIFPDAEHKAFFTTARSGIPFQNGQKDGQACDLSRH